MRMSRLKTLLIQHEGLRLKPYTCTEGKLTIGVGRNLDDRGITRAEAHMLLENDIVECETEAARAFPWFANLSQPRKDVIISMVFNLGMTRLLGFKKMLEAMEQGNYYMAAVEMLNSKWAYQVKGRAIELARIMKDGSY